MFFLLFGCSDYEVNRRVLRDSYVQPGRSSGVDILWVVDNSASMFEEQDQLIAHASSFIGFLSLAPIDFQMGITTMDMNVENPGLLVGEMMTPDTPNLVQLFTEQMSLEEGSRDEQGFEAALAALDLEGVNGDVIRSQADLEIIFFTDEDDQSDLDADDFFSQLTILRGAPQISVNAIIGDPPMGCASIFGAADAGFKYQEIQEDTEGVRESICSLYYDALLNRLAMKVLGLQDRIFLTAPPDLSTVEVRVDDALIHQRERHGWRYDAGENSIVFDGYAVPFPGSEVVVTYNQWIGPPRDWDEDTDGGDPNKEDQTDETTTSEGGE